MVVLSQDRSKTPNFKKRGEGSFQALRIPGDLKILGQKGDYG